MSLPHGRCTSDISINEPVSIPVHIANVHTQSDQKINHYGNTGSETTSHSIRIAHQPSLSKPYTLSTIDQPKYNAYLQNYGYLFGVASAICVILFSICFVHDCLYVILHRFLTTVSSAVAPSAIILVLLTFFKKRKLTQYIPSLYSIIMSGMLLSTTAQQFDYSGWTSPASCTLPRIAGYGTAIGVDTSTNDTYLLGGLYDPRQGIKYNGSFLTDYGTSYTPVDVEWTSGNLFTQIDDTLWIYSRQFNRLDTFDLGTQTYSENQQAGPGHNGMLCYISLHHSIHILCVQTYLHQYRRWRRLYGLDHCESSIFIDGRRME